MKLQRAGEEPKIVIITIVIVSPPHKAGAHWSEIMLP